MQNEVQVFNFEANDVHTVVIENEVWFVGKDIANVLGYSNSRKTLADHVDEEDKQIIQRSQNVTLEIPNRGLTLINQSGVISLALSSKLPSARKFKRWVTSEVIPSVLKHGAYLTNQKIEEVLTSPDTIIRLATELKEERQAKLLLLQENSVLTQQNNELKPKADYVDSILSNKSLVTITFIAKDYGMSGTAMNKLLHDLGVQYNQSGIWLLYAKHQKKRLDTI